MDRRHNAGQKLCACGCGRAFSANRGSEFHPSCRAPRPCACGCGLLFPATQGRRYHPQCATRTKGWVRYRDMKLMARGPKKVRRCQECEDQSWRRPRRRKCLCGKRFAPEMIDRHGSSTGCAIAFVL